jgi:hypothetical protein
MWKRFAYTMLFAVMVIASRPAQAQITGSNWAATFYNDTTLTTPVATRNYPNGVYFNWGGGPPLNADNATPVAGVNIDNFSATFSSTQTFVQGGTYVFTTYVDDGVRVHINDELMLNEFNVNSTPGYRTFVFHRDIAAGAQLDIRVDYVEYIGNAVIVFQWGLVLSPAELEIYTPENGTMVYGDLSPVFRWQFVGAPSYLFKLWKPDGTVVLKASYPAAAVCEASVCTLDMEALPGRQALTLESGPYLWRVKTQGVVPQRKSRRASFTVEYPGQPLSLTPNFYTIVANVSPALTWGEVEAANAYKVVLIRTKNGEKANFGWQAAAAYGCDGIWCTLDLAALSTPVILKRGGYTWRVYARDDALMASVSKSNPAAFRVEPGTRSTVLPPPQAPDGFRTP